RFIKLGASGVQMATRFVATYECDASMEFKQAYINAKKEDVVIIKSPVGMPGRAIRNQFLIDVENNAKKPDVCRYNCLKTCDPKKAPYCISQALINAQKGNLDEGFAFCGENVYKVDKIVHVDELISELVREAEENL
ncbi:MAG TPA: nitronate monooxygenase, partial [Coprothermobacter proteolyticus]|nr:nitronate monooxygenase [Coprothermobacter proteolyticus]